MITILQSVLLNLLGVWFLWDKRRPITYIGIWFFTWTLLPKLLEGERAENYHDLGAKIGNIIIEYPGRAVWAVITSPFAAVDVIQDIIKVNAREHWQGWAWNNPEKAETVSKWFESYHYRYNFGSFVPFQQVVLEHTVPVLALAGTWLSLVAITRPMRRKYNFLYGQAVTVRSIFNSIYQALKVVLRQTDIPYYRDFAVDYYHETFWWCPGWRLGGYILVFIYQTAIYRFLLWTHEYISNLEFWYVVSNALFLFKFVRVIVHTLVYYVFYKPIPIPEEPSYRSQDCTVVMTVENDLDRDFPATIRSILDNEPARIIIFCGDFTTQDGCLRLAIALDSHIPIDVIMRFKGHPRDGFQRDREYFSSLVSHVRTPITIWAGEGQFWPENFLPPALAPFEDPDVMQVGTTHRMLELKAPFTWPGESSHCIYILHCMATERENFDTTSPNFLDGGAPYISPKSALLRTDLLQSYDFTTAFLHEYSMFGLLGPIDAGAPEFIARYIRRKGYKSVMQHDERAVVTISERSHKAELGEWTDDEFHAQRIAWRNSIAHLINPFHWLYTPWSTYAVYLNHIIHMPFLYDSALLISTLLADLYGGSKPILVLWISSFILVSKVVKLIPYFWRNPHHIAFVPNIFVSSLFFVVCRLMAMITMTETTVVNEHHVGNFLVKLGRFCIYLSYAAFVISFISSAIYFYQVYAPYYPSAYNAVHSKITSIYRQISDAISFLSRFPWGWTPDKVIGKFVNDVLGVTGVMFMIFFSLSWWYGWYGLGGWLAETVPGAAGAVQL